MRADLSAHLRDDHLLDGLEGTVGVGIIEFIFLNVEIVESMPLNRILRTPWKARWGVGIIDY